MKNYHEDNKSFMMYKEWEDYFESLDNMEEAGELIMALFAFAKRGEIAEFKGALKMAFIMMTKQLDRDGKKWEERCRINAENGKKGGRPVKPVENTDENEKPKKTERFPEKPNKKFTQNKTKKTSEFEGAKTYDFSRIEELMSALNNSEQA
jgi:hypothetical protein